MPQIEPVSRTTYEPYEPYAQVSPITAAQHARIKTADTLDIIRDGARKIEKMTTYRYIVDGYERMSKNRRFDASCTLLGIIGAFLTIGASAYNPQSTEFAQLSGVGNLMGQLGSGASRLTQEEQSEIDGLLKRLAELQKDAQGRDGEVDRILTRLDELQSRIQKQIADAETQMMRNSQ